MADPWKGRSHRVDHASVRRALMTVQGDDPTPEFVASLRATLADQQAIHGPTANGQSTMSVSSDRLEPLSIELDADSGPAASRGVGRSPLRVAVGVGFVVIMVLLGVVLAQGGGRESTQELHRAQGSTFPSELADGIVQPGDVNVEVAAASAQSLEEVWGPEYPAERAAYRRAGFVDGLTATFDWQGFERELGGVTAAYRFEDDRGAAAALEVADQWYREKPRLVFRNPRIDDLVDIEVTVGDESVGYLHGNIIGGAMRGQGAVVLWRTGRVVHLLTMSIAVGLPDEHATEIDNLVSLAEAIDARR